MNDHSAGDNENRVEFFENATEIVCPIQNTSLSYRNASQTGSSRVGI